MLEEYAGTFAYWGSVSMIPFFLCPLMACWTIIKWGFADFFEPIVFIDGLVRSLLFYQYAKLLEWQDMTQSNLLGVVLSVIYTSVYFHYLSNKMKFYKSMAKWASFTVLVLLYANWVSKELASVHIEYIIAVYNLLSMIYPFQGVKLVYKNKCTFGIPYPVVFAGQIVCTFWLLFAISVHNYLLMVQLAISFVLGAIQIVFFFVYPSHPTFVSAHPPTQSHPDTDSADCSSKKTT
ncbi:sugar transporter SWEET1-like [Planococcus citri]|uniref:sugar transporter SWEET1-like n=1 Tax=Planococcus citri TaxID=170843 RepID=UPI0031F7F281